VQGSPVTITSVSTVHGGTKTITSVSTTTKTVNAGGEHTVTVLPHQELFTCPYND
jgi:hypothetical protein